MRELNKEEANSIMNNEQIAYRHYMGGFGDTKTNRTIFVVNNREYLFEVGEIIPQELIEAQNIEGDEAYKEYLASK